MNIPSEQLLHTDYSPSKEGDAWLNCAENPQGAPPGDFMEQSKALLIVSNPFKDSSIGSRSSNQMDGTAGELSLHSKTTMMMNLSSILC